jgi:hypothetical protein
MKHLKPVFLDPNLLEQLPGIVYLLLGSGISLQEMALSLKSPRDENGIGTPFKGRKEVKDIKAARARELDDAHRGRVFQPHRPGQISRRVSAIGTAKCHDLRLEISHLPPSLRGEPAHIPSVSATSASTPPGVPLA